MTLELIFVATGWIGVIVEFLRPGLVLPGVAGAVLLAVGYAKLIPQNAGAAVGITLPFLAIGLWLLLVARKARRNKRAL